MITSDMLTQFNTYPLDKQKEIIALLLEQLPEDIQQEVIQDMFDMLIRVDY